MKEENKNRIKWLHVRITIDEHATISSGFKSTTEKKLSDYVRKLLLKKPMIKAVKNTSLTDIIGLLTMLQKDLNGVANNFNQAVRKLNTYKDDSSIAATVVTLKLHEKSLIKTIDEVRTTLINSQAKWLQE